MDFWSKLLDPTGFIPRAQCGAWTPALIRLHNVSDFLIWTAYLAIPLVLIVLAAKGKQQIPFRGLFWLFGLFILACGTTHLMDIVLFYKPLYYLSGAIKLVTALASWGTVIALLYVVPQALSMRSAVQLAQEVSERTSELRDAHEKLHLAHEELEQLADRMPQIVWTARPDGAFDYFNQRWFEYTGLSNYDDLSASQYQSSIHPDDVPAFLNGWQEAVSCGNYHETEYRFRRADGTYRWHLTRALPVKDRDGQLTRWVGTCTDIDDQKSVQEALRQANEHLALELEERKHLQKQLELENDRMPMGRIVWDTNFRVKTWNPAACAIFGYEAHEALGRSAYELVLRQEDRPFFEQLWQTILEEHNEPRSINENLTRHGQTIICEWSNTALRNEEGEVDEVLSMVQDITQREQAKAELERAKEQAERANRAKDEMLSRTSHELRTPLNAILGFAQILAMGDLDQDQREGIDHVLGAGRHLLELINELLDIARIAQGQNFLELEPVSLARVSRDIWPLIQSMASEHRVHLSFDAASWGDLFVMGDAQRLNQVLLNLLTNAIKYNVEGGSVTLSAHTESRPAGSVVQIEVRDTGVGIAPELIPDLFVPFNRLGAERRTRIPGTGLGLTISKSLVEAMNGTLSFESIVGQGTIFRVEVPTSAPVLLDFGPEAPPTDELPTTTTSILYIEDNLSNYAVIEMLLSDHKNIHLISAIQGSLGLELAKKHLPDLILLDLNLPDIMGDEVLRQLKLMPATRHIPVAILSADATPGQVERLLAAGAEAYMTKPLDIKEFLVLLKRMIG